VDGGAGIRSLPPIMACPPGLSCSQAGVARATPPSPFTRAPGSPLSSSLSCSLSSSLTSSLQSSLSSSPTKRHHLQLESTAGWSNPCAPPLTEQRPTPCTCHHQEQVVDIHWVQSREWCERDVVASVVCRSVASFRRCQLCNPAAAWLVHGMSTNGIHGHYRVLVMLPPALLQ
jgi:hypothetical protein